MKRLTATQTRVALHDAGLVPIARRPRAWKLQGDNFMTPLVVCYLRDEEGTYIEVSMGEGIFRDQLWGVTHNRNAGERPCEDDGVFGSLEELIEHLKGVEEVDD